MRNNAALLAVAFAATALAGCFTVYETETPKVVLSKVVGDKKVAVEGFLTTVVSYIPVYSTSTTFIDEGPFYHGRRYRHYEPGPGPMLATSQTETLIPQVNTTDAYLKRVQSRLEEAGCILRSAPAKYIVSGEFAGPFDPPGANWRRAGIDLGTGLFALYDTASYTLSVKVYEQATGKPLFAQNYEQTYSATGFSPLWILGMMAYENITSSYQHSWCLSVLTDRAMADVSAFLAQIDAQPVPPADQQPPAQQPVVQPPAAPVAQ